MFRYMYPHHLKSEFQNFDEKKLVPQLLAIFFSKYYLLDRELIATLKNCVENIFLGSLTRVNFEFQQFHPKRVILLSKSNLFPI